MERLINSNGLSIKFINENILKFIFEEIFHERLLKSEFELKLQEIVLTEKLDNVHKKIKYLTEENEDKNGKIKNLENKMEKIQKENKEMNKITKILKNQIKFIREKNREINQKFTNLEKKVGKIQEENLNEDLIRIENESNISNELSLQELRDQLEFYKNSKILKYDELSLIKQWLGKKIKMDLIYSSDIHGQDVQTFHTKCDGEDNTLVLVESEYHRRFGGFTKLKWSSNCGYVEGDGSDFIFSLTKKRRFKNNNKKKAIANSPIYFPTFGGGNDFYLGEDCFKKNKNAYSNFKNSYGFGEKTDGFKNKYLAGCKNFKVLRIEVFKINF